MYLTSLKGLDDLIKTTDLYKSKKGMYKDLLIDKVNLFVSTIIYQHRRKGYNVSEGVPLHSEVLKQLIGVDYYISISKLLIELDIIYKDNKYISTTICVRNFLDRKPESKKYSITQKGLELGIYDIGVLTKNIKRKIQGFRDREYKKYLRHPLHKKILFGMSDICPDLEACEKVVDEVRQEGNLDRILTYEAALETLKRFCGIKTLTQLLRDPAFFYRVSKSGRVYHTISNLPSKLRQHLTTHSGEPLTELDMYSAQPFLLSCEFIKHAINEGDEDVKEESRKLWRIFANPNLNKFNGFYYEFANASGFSTDFNDDSVYKSVKQGFMKAMYKHNSQETEYSKALEKTLPYFYNYIQDIKKYDYKNGAFIGQSAEADIFIDNYFSSLNSSATSIPVHDSVLVPKSNSHDAHLILAKGVNKRYEFIDMDFAMRIINNYSKVEEIDPFDDYGYYPEDI